MTIALVIGVPAFIVQSLAKLAFPDRSTSIQVEIPDA
jgi:hypothetical protein